MSFKVGDIVRVKPDVKDPTYAWGDATPQCVGPITEIYDKGATPVLIVDFPSQRGWSAKPDEMELVTAHRRKSPEKILGYAVLNKDGTARSFTACRKTARKNKAALGGKQQGVTIVVLKSGKEIR